MNALDVTIEWTYEFDKATGWWVGICDNLNLSICEKTFLKLRLSGEDVIDLLFESLVENGDAEKFLVHNGVKDLEPWRPLIEAKKRMTWDVPMTWGERQSE